MGRIFWAILLGGAVAGALDITYAITAYGPLSFGAPPERILQSVAAGAIGREAARAGEWDTALLGLALHFAIATGMAAAYVLAATRIRLLTERALLCGILYGLALYVAMNYVIVPLSAAGENGHFAASLAEAGARLGEAFSAVRPPYNPDHPWLLAGTLFAHTVLVGLPIALITRRFSD